MTTTKQTDTETARPQYPRPQYHGPYTARIYIRNGVRSATATRSR